MRTGVRSCSLFAFFAACCVPVFVLDVLIGPQVCPWALYLLPVGVAGWLCGRQFALGLATLTLVLIAAGAWLGGQPFDSTWHFLLSVSNRAVSLYAVALLAAAGSAVSVNSGNSAEFEGSRLS